jgi:predicted lipoprotein with Yx(FWY)xxD motif
MTRTAIGAALAALAVGVAACGGGDDEQPAAAAPADATVSVEQVDGVGPVLVDSSGNALYTADQEDDGTIRCTDSCLSIWLPLEASGTPTGSDDVTGELATVKRPEGAKQVTYDGKPLYRFAEDPGPGKVTGDGLSDSFGGTAFTWHAVTTSGSSSSGGSGRGYGY